MPFIRIKRNWQLAGKEMRTVSLDVREGFFNDTMRLYVDDVLVATEKAGMAGRAGYTLFEIDGRTHELRWVWSFLSGNPISIVIMRKGRILAQYGNDRAAEDAIYDYDQGEL